MNKHLHKRHYNIRGSFVEHFKGEGKALCVCSDSYANILHTEYTGTCQQIRQLRI